MKLDERIFLMALYKQITGRNAILGEERKLLKVIKDYNEWKLQNQPTENQKSTLL
jgi:hypothetical protein